MFKKLLHGGNLILWVVALLSLAVVFVMPNRYYQDIVILTLLWAGISSSWNIYSGYCGRLSIGHAAYLGIGAYSSTILYVDCGLSPWIGMLVGGVLAGIAALILGGVTLRLKGTFFVLSTIAFAEIMRAIIINAKELTQGSLGIQIPWNPGLANMIFSGKGTYAILIWIYMIAAILICLKLEKSKLGFGLIAVGQNQEAAENLGVNSTKTMLIAYVMSAVMTAFGGTLFAQYIMYIEPASLMGITYSVYIILYAIAGGMGTAFGPMLGAFILVPVTNVLRGTLSGISGLHGLILGLVLMGILLWKPDGILPSIRMALYKHKIKKEKQADAAAKVQEGGSDVAED